MIWKILKQTQCCVSKDIFLNLIFICLIFFHKLIWIEFLYTDRILTSSFCSHLLKKKSWEIKIFEKKSSSLYALINWTRFLFFPYSLENISVYIFRICIPILDLYFIKALLLFIRAQSLQNFGPSFEQLVNFCLEHLHKIFQKLACLVKRP